MIKIEVIGRRLAQLRSELACPGEDSWSQERLAEATGLTRNMVTRLEKQGAGTIEAFLTLLVFYEHRGYNVKWVIMPDNSTVSKMALNDEKKSIDAQLVHDKLTKFRELIDKDVVELIDCLTA